MINKKCHSSARCESIIRYMFGAKIDDADKRPNIEFIGGNVVSGSPFRGYNSQNIRHVDTRELEQEFNAKMRLYGGPGKNLVSHYVLSLPKEDNLTNTEFNKLVNSFLSDLGANRTATWCAARHEDTAHSHVHIALCRVQMTHDDQGRELHYGLLSDQNDYERGMESVRKLEKEYNLTRISSPGEDHNHKNQASIIRAISKKTLSTNPSTVSDFVRLMANEGVEIRAELDNKSGIRGLSYRLNSDDGRWITGSTIMSTKLTFGAITRNLDYQPERDDQTLGLGSSPRTPTCAAFARPKTEHIGLLAKKANLNSNLIKLTKNHPMFYIIRYKNSYQVGLRIKCTFHPSPKPTLIKNSFQMWEDLVSQMFRSIMKMMKDSFKGTIFEAKPWEKDLEIICGSESTSLVFEDLNYENMAVKLSNAERLIKSEILELTKIVEICSSTASQRNQEIEPS